MLSKEFVTQDSSLHRHTGSDEGDQRKTSIILMFYNIFAAPQYGYFQNIFFVIVHLVGTDMLQAGTTLIGTGKVPTLPTDFKKIIECVVLKDIKQNRPE